ncbi:MAG: TetR/AcrR family transcriptional regulator [Trichodesmium sp. MO_231.B1]|nr:TetR/AcrR family transcriptional regulator [Trichodesmium sp. MO_231.B1]
MGRQKQFNRDEVLMKAMETFWCYGYEGTSIQTLVENMGINRGSLYDTFGDKLSLFHEAIAYYDSMIVTKAIARLEAPGAAKQAIIDQFYGLIDRAVADSDHKGCLLTNTAVEMGARNSDTTKQVTNNIQRIENVLKKALTTAQKKGEISHKKDISALAKFLTCCLQGLRVISKINPDREALQDIAKIALSVLD